MAELMGTRETYGETLVELGRLNPNIVVLDADLSSSTMTKFFAKEYPDRFFDMGVSEQDMMGTAAGLALTGKIPFASTFAVFASGRAWEQVRQAIAYPNLGVKIVASHGGISVGEDGASHQMTEDLALMRVIPNMRVLIPADGMEMKAMMKVIIDTPGPFYVRTSRMKFPVLYDEKSIIPDRPGECPPSGKRFVDHSCRLYGSCIPKGYRYPSAKRSIRPSREHVFHQTD